MLCSRQSFTWSLSLLHLSEAGGRRSNSHHFLPAQFVEQVQLQLLFGLVRHGSLVVSHALGKLRRDLRAMSSKIAACVRRCNRHRSFWCSTLW